MLSLTDTNSTISLLDEYLEENKKRSQFIDNARITELQQKHGTTFDPLTDQEPNPSPYRLAEDNSLGIARPSSSFSQTANEVRKKRGRQPHTSETSTGRAKVRRGKS